MMVRFNKKENGERKELLSSMNQIEENSHSNPHPKHNDNGKNSIMHNKSLKMSVNEIKHYKSSPKA